MSQALQAIREAATDGRLQNVIYRQTQLEKLQKALLDEAGAIELAIKEDTGHSDLEVGIEYTLTLQCIHEYYNLLNADDALHEEYSIARDEDAPCLRDGIGIVYVVPLTYTRLYSIIGAVSAAITAGNCVVIEAEKTLNKLPTLLPNILKAALDPSIIEFVSPRSSDSDLGLDHIRVYQRGMPDAEEQVSLATRSAPLISANENRVVVVVDRDADLKNAAEAIVIARYIFGGNSPYAPDIVLVNEFAKAEFLAALLDEQLRFSARYNAAKPIDSDSAAKVQQLIASAIETKDIDVASSNSKGSIYDLIGRRSEILTSKIVGRHLIIHSITSLDDAIDLANRDDKELLASYIFADLASAKYLSQFIKSSSSFVNQVPFEMLVGPAIPRSATFHRKLRYSIEQLSVARPKFATTSSSTQFVVDSIRNQGSVVLANRLKEVSTTLKPKKPRSTGGQIGFFEQGILTGLGIFGSLALVTTGTVGFFAVRYVSKLRS